MAGGGPSNIGSSRRKNLEADLNLVPFIDLLSVCICFLLMTAVWVQIGALKVKQSHGTSTSQTVKQDLEVDVAFRGKKSAAFTIKKNNRNVVRSTLKSESFEGLLASIDSKLAGFSRKIKASLADRVGAARIVPSKGLDYGSLVRTIDVLKKNEIGNVGIVPVRGY